MFRPLSINLVCEVNLNEKIKIPKILLQRRPNDTLNLIPFIILAAVINFLQAFEPICVSGFRSRYDITGQVQDCDSFGVAVAKKCELVAYEAPIFW